MNYMTLRISRLRKVAAEASRYLYTFRFNLIFDKVRTIFRFQFFLVMLAYLYSK